ncbi:hypothetical protein D3C75_419400 [compost metagenome]
MSQISIETAIPFQRMALHLCDGPVTILEIMGDVTVSSTLNRIAQQWVVRNNCQTVVFTLYTANKPAEERFDKLFWLSDFAVLFGMNHCAHAVTVHHFFHLRWRNKVTFLGIHFEEAKAFFRAFNHAFNAWSLGMQLLFKLREQRIILEHVF